jgi:hypothetical protein
MPLIFIGDKTFAKVDKAWSRVTSTEGMYLKLETSDIRPMKRGDEQPVTNNRLMSALSRFVPVPWPEIIGRGRTVGPTSQGLEKNARGTPGASRLLGMRWNF